MTYAFITFSNKPTIPEPSTQPPVVPPLESLPLIHTPSPKLASFPSPTHPHMHFNSIYKTKSGV